MGNLWPFSKLVECLKNSDPDVRLWACRHLGRFYPEKAGSVLSGFLEHPDPSLAAKVAEYFYHHPDPQAADSLLNLFQKDSDKCAGWYAGSLAKLGDERFVPFLVARWEENPYHLFLHPLLGTALITVKEEEGRRLARKTLTSLLNDTRLEKERVESLVSAGAAILLHPNRTDDIVFLLESYLQSDRLKKSGYSLLAAIAQHGGVNCDEKELEEDGIEILDSPPEIFSDLLKKKKFLQAIERSIEQAALLQEGSEKGLSGKKESQPVKNLKILKAFEQVLPLIRKQNRAVQQRLAITALLVHARLEDCKEFLNVSLNELTKESILALLFTHRDHIPEDEELLTILSNVPDREPLLKACAELLKKNPDSFEAFRALKLLGLFKSEEAVEILLDFFFENPDEYLADTLGEILPLAGEAAIPPLERAFNRASTEEIGYLLPAFSGLPFEGITRLLTRHFSSFHKTDRHGLLDAIESIGAREFIPLLKSVMKDDEPEEEVFAFLCSLHGVQDPELPRIRKRMEERAKEYQERLAMFESGQPRAFFQETIPLLLRCLACDEAYTYRVREVFAGENIKGNPEFFIRDLIRCKNCKTENRYELTPGAHLFLLFTLTALTELAKTGTIDINEGPLKLGRFVVNGKTMMPEEGVAYYEKAISSQPNLPDLRIGYGNLLLFLRKKEKAKEQFEKAVALEPKAVEALHLLAEMELESGRLDKAYSLYKACQEAYPEGKFFRSTPKVREEIRASASSMTRKLAEELGISPPESTGVLQLPYVAKKKIGRNEPCPCGSGKKYKKCCNEKDEKRIPEAPLTMTCKEELQLIERLVRFAESPRFHKDRAEALKLCEHDDESMKFFADWFIHDYPLKEGSTVIEVFSQTEGTKLPPLEREILNRWLDSSFCFYEVLDSRPETAEIFLKELLTGEELVVHDASSSRGIVKWDILFTRILPVQDKLRPFRHVIVFPPRSREKLVAFLTGEWNRFKQETGKKEWKKFMKACANRIWREVALQEEGMPPKFYTPKHHELVFCKAYYDTQNAYGCIFRLKVQRDFSIDEENGANDSESASFAWLEKGESAEAIPVGKPTDQGIVITRNAFPSPDSEPIPVLGNVRITPKRLVLETFSRESLQAGKKRIEELLGEYVRFRMETFEEAEQALKNHPGESKRGEKNTGSKTLTPAMQMILERTASRQMEEWLLSPIPALQGKSPMESLAVPGGKEKVEQLLREFENAEERKKRNGEPYLNVNLLRERLGLSKVSS